MLSRFMSVRRAKGARSTLEFLFMKRDPLFVAFYACAHRAERNVLHPVAAIPTQKIPSKTPSSALVANLLPKAPPMAVPKANPEATFHLT